MSDNLTLRIARRCFLLALFVVPFSTALTNVFVVFTYLSFLPVLFSNGEARKEMKSPSSLLAVGLFALIAMSALWSIAPQQEIVEAIRKYSKLLLIPVGLALARHDKTLPRRALSWFVAGTAVLSLSSYLVWLNLMPTGSTGWWSAGDANNAFVFKHHITMGVFLGFAALICLNYYFYAVSRRARIAAAFGAVFYAFPVMFLTQGRTGYVVLFVGLVALCVIRFHANWRTLVTSILVAITIFAGFFATSSNFKLRANQFISEVEDYSGSRKMNSSGTRLSYYRAGLQLMAANPVLGLGAGSFSEGFAPIAKQLWNSDDPHYSVRHQPHSEIILMGVQLGLVGWLMYFSLIGSLIVAACKSRSYETDILLLLCIVFGTAAAFNSLLWDAAEGHWFALLAGCLYGYARHGRVAVS